MSNEARTSEQRLNGDGTPHVCQFDADGRCQMHPFTREAPSSNLRASFDEFCRQHCSPGAMTSNFYWRLFQAGAAAVRPVETSAPTTPMLAVFWREVIKAAESMGLKKGMGLDVSLGWDVIEAARHATRSSVEPTEPQPSHVCRWTRLPDLTDPFEAHKVRYRCGCNGEVVSGARPIYPDDCPKCGKQVLPTPQLPENGPGEQT